MVNPATPVAATAPAHAIGTATLPEAAQCLPPAGEHAPVPAATATEPTHQQLLEQRQRYPAFGMCRR